MRKQKIQISDLYRLKLVSDPQISPDGSKVIFVVETMHKGDKKYYTNLWLVPSKGGRPRKLTHGKKNDSCPRWSPDGKTIAFISKRPAADGSMAKREDSGQIWLLPMEGGEAQLLTNLPRGDVSAIKWSPNGKEIGFLFHPVGKEVTFKKGKPEVPAFRHIKDIWYRLDGVGFLGSEFTHVWAANSSTGATRQIVAGKWYDISFDWSPDSKKIAFVSNRREDWQYHFEEDELYLVSAKGGGRVKKIDTPSGHKDGVSFSPDGKRLAYIGHERPYEGWGVVNYTVRTVGVDGSDLRSHTNNLDRTAYPLTLGDLTPSFIVTAPTWSPDGTQLYFNYSSEGTSLLSCVDVDSNKINTVVNEKVVVTFSMDFNRNKIAIHGGQPEAPDELFVHDLAQGTHRQVTHMNRPYIAGRRFNVSEEVWFKSGQTKIQGWIVKPPGFSGNRKYPFILQIHGGPRCQYGRLYFHEMQVLAASGYVVMYTNPRGSQGYGEKFADAITSKWGEPAMTDLMAAVDYAVSLGYVDEKQLGVTGGSYGGYMTNWIVTHTDRFKAAVTQRSVSNFASMFGTSDVGFDMQWEFKATPWEDPELYAKWSPITYIDKCITPLLIIHSEHDWRCNLEQDDQMFTALKYLKREVEYVRFPEEPHGLSRHGRPDRREARLKFIVEWFDRYLKT